MKRLKIVFAEIFVDNPEFVQTAQKIKGKRKDAAGREKLEKRITKLSTEISADFYGFLSYTRSYPHYPRFWGVEMWVTF